MVTEQVGELGPADGLMQECGMDRIHRVLLNLQPVAFGNGAAADVPVGGQDRIFPFEDVVLGKFRHAVGRPHIGENQTAEFVRRVPGLPDIVLAFAVGWLSGLLKATAFEVEKPAVIAAANAFGLNFCVLHRRPAMGAMAVDQAGPAVAIPETHQVLTEEANRLGQIRQFLGQAKRLPVAPHEFAHRRAELHVRQFGVLLRPYGNPAVPCHLVHQIVLVK